MQKIISIVTGWGPELGTGHVQRMATLYHYLSKHPDIEVHFVAPPLPRALSGITEFIPDSKIHKDSVLIVRDMRDSSANEILQLQSTAPVVAIDDLGPGRKEADFVLDLLPNIPYRGSKSYREDLYLYGFTFIQSLTGLKTETIKKDIDLVFYTGLGASKNYKSFLLSVIPDDHNAVLLTGSEPFYHNLNDNQFRNTGYAEFLSRARIFVSHFGISLYEAHICGCRLVSINPSEYHSSLADSAASSLKMTNLGVYGIIETAPARSRIVQILKKTESMIKPDVCLQKADRPAAACAAYIRGLI